MSDEQMKRDVAVRFKKGNTAEVLFPGLGGQSDAYFQLDADLYDDTLVAQAAARILAGEQILFDTIDGGIYILDGSVVSSVRISEPRHRVSKWIDPRMRYEHSKPHDD